MCWVTACCVYTQNAASIHRVPFSFYLPPSHPPSSPFLSCPLSTHSKGLWIWGSSLQPDGDGFRERPGGQGPPCQFQQPRQSRGVPHECKSLLTVPLQSAENIHSFPYIHCFHAGIVVSTCTCMYTLSSCTYVGFLMNFYYDNYGIGTWLGTWCTGLPVTGPRFNAQDGSLSFYSFLSHQKCNYMYIHVTLRTQTLMFMQ